jgi:YggT family protein
MSYPPGLLGLAFEIISIVLRLFSIVLIVYVVISWLYAFDVVSRRNAFVASTWEFTRRISDPVLRPLRRIIPPIAGVDLSVMVLLLIVWLLQSNVLPWVYLLLTGRGSIL